MLLPRHSVPDTPRRAISVQARAPSSNVPDSSSTTSFADNTVTNGNTYYYAVSAVDLAGQESPDLSFENVFDTPRPEGFGVTLTNSATTDATSGWDFSGVSRHPSGDPATDMY